MQRSGISVFAVLLLVSASPAAGILMIKMSNASAKQPVAHVGIARSNQTVAVATSGNHSNQTLVVSASLNHGNQTVAVATIGNYSPATDLLNVARLRAKLAKVSSGLARLLEPSSPLARTESAKPLTVLTEAIDNVLNETALVSANSSVAEVLLAEGKLNATLSNVRSISMAISERQVQLASEDQAQVASLLIGVLMARRHESRAKQMEVLQDPQFADLAVVKRVLATNDTRTPLYKQVAIAMDGGNTSSATTASPPQKHDEPQQRQHVHFQNISQAVGNLKARIHTMEQGEQRLRQLHEKRIEALNKTVAAKAQTMTPAMAARLRAARKRIDREFTKEEAMTEREINGLRDAVRGMESHNVTVVENAQKELKATLAAIEAKAGKFIYFIQLVQRASNSDCPYCSAECLENCHSSGQSYSVCLTNCDDAGK